MAAGESGRLTFDVRGGRKRAKTAVGRPIDGRVRRLLAHRVEKPSCSPPTTDESHRFPCHPN